MERQHIKAALRTCGFEPRQCREFLVNTEFGSWRSFSSVNTDFFDALGDRLKIAGFNITVRQTLNLSVLKFWVEDKHRMREGMTSRDFQEEITQYFPLYHTFLIAQNASRIMPTGPRFSVDGYDEFYSGAQHIFRSILGGGGAPLSYVIRSGKYRPSTSFLRHASRNKKIYWKAPHRGAIYVADNLRVLTYLLDHCRDTPGWSRIQRYRDAGDGREAWLALCRNHGVNDIEPQTDPTYEDDDYIYIDHRLPIYAPIYDRWYQARQNRQLPSSSEMNELHLEFFTGSRCGGIVYGFNMNPGHVRPEKVRELARRSTSNAPLMIDYESLVVTVNRVSELLQPVGNIRSFAQMVLRTLQNMRIVSQHGLNLTLRSANFNPELEGQFIRQFREHSEQSHVLSELELCFLRSTAHYMGQRYDYDHEYFQRMIERDDRTNPDMNIAIGIEEGNTQMIALAVQRGIHLHHPAVIALSNQQENHAHEVEQDIHDDGTIG